MAKKGKADNGIEVDIFTEGSVNLPYLEISEELLKNKTIKILKYLNLQNAALSLIITDNDQIKGINRKYRGKDKATDVISFAYRENPFPEIKPIEDLGDIFISIEKALEQSEKFEVSIVCEVTKLLVHGILHLIGYDHEKTAEDARKMEELEENILNNICYSEQ